MCLAVWTVHVGVMGASSEVIHRTPSWVVNSALNMLGSTVPALVCVMWWSARHGVFEQVADQFS